MPICFDDFIVPVVAENPVTLLKHLGKALTLTAESLARSGMQINDKPGKTEVLVDFNGTGEQYAANLLKCAHVASIKASGSTFKALDVQIVEQFRHLGSYNAGCQQHAYEAAICAAQCISAFKAFSNKFYRQSSIPQSRRLLVLQSLTQSKLLHHVSTWAHPPSSVFSTLRSAYHKGLRAVANCPPTHSSKTNQRVRTELAVPSIEFLVSNRRLALFRRVLAQRSPWLTGMVAALATFIGPGPIKHF